MSHEIEALVRTHQTAIWRYLRFLGCDEPHADDLTQETFLAVLDKPFADRGPGAARNYLRRVARNKFLMAIRRGRVRPAFSDLEGADAVWVAHQDDDGAAYMAALEACLELLPERARRALDLFYRDGVGRGGLARVLGLTADGVKTLMRRTRESLRGCILRKVRS